MAGLAAVLAACGGVREADGLIVTRADGSKIDFLSGVHVRCGSPFEGEGREADELTLHISATRPTSRAQFDSVGWWSLSVLLSALRRDRFVRLPESTNAPSAAGSGYGPVLFVADGPGKNELSSHEEESSGRIEFHRFSCNPPSVDVSIDATLGSEFHDGPRVRVSGRLHTS